MNTGHNSEAMRRLWQPTRPYRIIYSLYMEFEPLPTEPPEKTTTLIVAYRDNWLDEATIAQRTGNDGYIYRPA